MEIHPISTSEIIFRSHIKTLFKKGKLPIKYGLYGGELTPKNVTDEHIVCRCFGGTNDISNIALATAENNNKRGNKPIDEFLTFGMIRKYFLQFKGLKANGFDGDDYIKKLKITLRSVLND